MSEGFSLVNTLIAYGGIQGLFIAITLIVIKPASPFKNLFGALLLIEAITLFERLLVETSLINAAPHLLGISYPISFLKPPLMLFMAMAITRHGFKLKIGSLWHLLPFCLMLALNIPFYTLSGNDKLLWVANFMQQIPSYTSFEFYFTLSFFAYIGSYVFYAIRALSGFKKHTTNNHLVNWYHKLLILYSAFLLLHLIYFAVQPLGQLNFAIINQVSMLSMAFIIQAIALVFLRHSSLNAPIDVPDKSLIEKQELDWQTILDKIESDKVYLDDALTLTKFSKLVLLPEKHISKIINSRLNLSFTRLINQYRIAEAKRIMDDSKAEKIKLMEIGFRSGFNNKVSFYRAFKELEKMAPSEYYEENL